MIPAIQYYLFYTPMTWIVPIMWLTMPGSGWRVRVATFAFGGAYWANWQMHDWPFTANRCIYPELRLDEGSPF